MAEKKVKKAATKKRKITTSVDKGRVYIQSSFNNTIVTVTDAAGNALAACSAGALGYKGSKKSTPFAAGQAAEKAAKIAKEYGCRITTFPKGNITIVEPARNFAIQQATHSWVLVVDADEIITPELRDYLYKKIEEPNCPTGLFISRHNMYLGKYGNSRQLVGSENLRSRCNLGTQNG